MRSATEGTARWLDDRTGLAGLTKKQLRKVFPDHWSFMLGEIALWSFVVLLITGVFLTLWFDPSMTEVTYEGSYDELRGLEVSAAYASTLHISFDVRGGLLMRQTHHWAANIFVAAMFIHMIRVFATGAFRKPRELNWAIGTLMLVLGILEGFAGYSLPDDLLSGTGLRIAQGLMQSVPVVGTYLSFFVFGGQFPGDDILPRLYAVHVLLLPGLLTALIGAHMMLLVLQKHTQWKGPGRTESNVVGYPLMPVYLAKSGGFFFVVFGVLAGMGGLLHINPIEKYGPYDPAKVTADSQPDWYMGMPEGLLRLMPGVETTVWGHTIAWNVLVPGLLMPPLILTVFAIYPFLASWATGDGREHHTLQRPRDAPNRTGFLAAMMTLYGVLWAAGGDDVLALVFHVNLNTLVNTFRVAVVVGPVIAFIVARRWAISLQRHSHEQLVEGRETGIIRQSSEGGFSEAHRPLPIGAAYTIAAAESDSEARTEVATREGDGLLGRGRERVRRLVARAVTTDEGIDPASDGHGAGGGTPTEELAQPADGHQFDGRREVEGFQLRGGRR